MTTQTIKFFPRALLAASIVTCGAAGLALAQEAPTQPAAPAIAEAAANFLSLTDIESRLTSQGIRVTELEVKGSVLEVEGYDSNNREIELIVDRRNAEILSRQFDD